MSSARPGTSIAKVSRLHHVLSQANLQQASKWLRGGGSAWFQSSAGVMKIVFTAYPPLDVHMIGSRPGASGDSHARRMKFPGQLAPNYRYSAETSGKYAVIGKPPRTSSPNPPIYAKKNLGPLAFA